MSEEMGPNKRRTLEGLNPQLEAPFSLREYRGRVERIRSDMAGRGIDLLFLSAPESIHYVSGYASEWYQANGPAGWVPASGVAIHVDHDRPIQFDDTEEIPLLQFTSVSEDVRIYEGLGPDGFGFIARELAGEGWLGGSVGLEMRAYRPHRAASETFQAALAEAGAATIVDGTDVVRRVRRTKSPQELAYVRTAQRIADVGMTAAREALSTPGATELDVYGAMIQAMAAAGGEIAAIPLPVVSGPRAATVHGLASRRQIAPGDIVNVDLCGVYQRYHANMARCFSIGEPHPQVLEHIGKTTDSVRIVADVIRPDLPVRDLLDTVETYYREVGLLGDEWWVGGYELGVAFPPDWVGDFFYELGTDPGDEAFRPGDVVNYEANFYLPQTAGLAMSINTMAFTEEGAGFLQETPSEPIVVERSGAG
jgi:Xaa-Pro dipeptidase